MKKLLLEISLGIAPISFIPFSIAQAEKDGRWLLNYKGLNNQEEIVCEGSFISHKMKTIKCE